MTGDNFYVVRDFGQDLLIAGNHALHAAATVDVNEWEHSAVEEIVAHVDHVGLREEDHAIAIGVAVGKMNGSNIFAIQVDGDFVFKGDDGKRRLLPIGRASGWERR